MTTPQKEEEKTKNFYTRVTEKREGERRRIFQITLNSPSDNYTRLAKTAGRCPLTLASTCPVARANRGQQPSPRQINP